MLWIPVGFGHGFLVLSEVADFVYKCTNYYDPATEAGIRFDDPEVGVRVAVARSSCCIPSATRPRRCCRRSRTRCRSRCERALRTLAHGRPAPRQPADRAARVAVRALGGLVVRDADRGSRRGAGAAGVGRASSWRDLAAIGLDWDGEVRGRSRSAARSTRRRWRGCRSTSASARGPRSARARRPRTGRSGVYPGTCLRLTDAERAERRAAGRVPGAAGARRRPRACDFEDRVLGRAEGVVDDFVVRRNDGAFAYNLAVVVDDAAQGDRGGRPRRRPRRTRRRARSGSPGALGVPAAGLRARAAGARRGRAAAGEAPRRRDAARGRRCRTALAWMARSLGLAGRTARGAARRRSIRRAFRVEPTDLRAT